jgi:hypothetical protein
MVLRRAVVLVAAVFALQGLIVRPAAAAEPQGEKIGLRILYAGQPGSDREQDFLGFLGDHFATVGTADFSKFAEAQAKDFDVVILDWDGKDIRAPLPNLSQDYARATVTVGVPGGILCSRLGLKTGYL